MGARVIDMNETRRCAIAQLRTSVEGTGEVFQPVGGDEGRYGHILGGFSGSIGPRRQVSGCFWRLGQAGAKEGRTLLEIGSSTRFCNGY